MKITFKDKDLEKCALNEKYRVKKLGTLRAKLFLKRLDDFRNAENLEKTRFLPGNFHELVGDRKGQWACNLDQPYRLIFEPHEDPIPTDINGKYIWIEIKGIEIIEITNYHEK
ncbi:MAG: killer suppression protein HigA [Bacteroidales bacterium]|nr:killer suppression protein HigA [Bacteroidales bacterium]